jgi:hypothetical protein
MGVIENDLYLKNELFKPIRFNICHELAFKKIDFLTLFTKKMSNMYMTYHY